MELTPLGIEGAWLAESAIWKDDRGYFFESYNKKHFEEAGQAKWITCVSGSIQDVIVDIRPDSKTFGQWVDVELKGDSGKAVFISEGLGHGFLALEDNTAVAYLISTPFSPTDEYEINPLDEKIGVIWGLGTHQLKISEKDLRAQSLEKGLATGILPNFRKRELEN